MCGIGGIAQKNKSSVDRDLVKKMADLIEHRGRDGQGFHHDNNLGLFHNRLSIIDLSDAGHQPMSSPNGNIVMVFNGEIFNYIELRQELIAQGHTFTSSSDSEVLLKMFEVEGPSCFKKLDGMFAAVFYIKSTQSLVLVRDSSGIKPLYYYQDAQHFAFSSEVKAIVSSGAGQAQLNVEGLVDYINLQLYTKDRTLFKNIPSLTPGTYLEFSLKNWTFQHKTFFQPKREEFKGSYHEAIEELRKLLTESVRLWSRSDTPIGAYVSGGLDSSIVSALSQKVGLNSKVQDNIFTLASIFPDCNFKDEEENSTAVARFIKSNHHQILMKSEDVLKAHHDLIYTLDYPIAGYAAPFIPLSNFFRKHSKVALTGHGGDELFCGYPKYIFANLTHTINSAARGSGYQQDQILEALKYTAGFEQQGTGIMSASLFKEDIDIIRSTFSRSAHFLKCLNPDISEKAKSYDTFSEIHQQFNDLEGSFLKKLLQLDQKILLTGLLHVEDRISMRENLESRTPLLSPKLVEFSNSMPTDYLLRSGPKGMLRDAAEGLLPDLIIRNTRKTGVLYPVFELLNKGLLDLMQEDLAYLDKTGLFTSSASELLNIKKDLINQRNLWALWSLGSWLRSFKVSI